MVPPELLEFLTPYPAEVQQLTLDARLELIRLVGPANEIIWDATQAVCDGFFFTEKDRDCFVNLAVYADHVTLIFGFGAGLDDPEGRLKGGGTRVRHLRFAGVETLRDPYVEGLVHVAMAAAARPEVPLEPRVVVKVMNGPKRRPTPGG